MKKINLYTTLLAAGLIFSGCAKTPPVDTYEDKKTNLMWQDDVSVKTTKKDWHSAIAHCENLTHAGYSDWRLPTIDELLSITDDTKYNPAIVSSLKNVNVYSDHYWSSSPYIPNPSGAWYVAFSKGCNLPKAKISTELVRCVRDSK